MRQSTIVAALSGALAAHSALAGTETVLTFRYVAQENCIAAPDFTPFPDVDPYNYPDIGFSDFNGTLVFDLSNHKALFTNHGTFQLIPPPPPDNLMQGQVSGTYPAIFWTTQAPCTMNFALSPDLSFSLQSTSAGCRAVVIGGRPPSELGQGSTVFDQKLTGQFAPGMQSFIAGHSGWDQQQQPVVETQVFDNGYARKRICTSIMHGVKFGGGIQ